MSIGWVRAYLSSPFCVVWIDDATPENGALVVLVVGWTDVRLSGVVAGMSALGMAVASVVRLIHLASTYRRHTFNNIDGYDSVHPEFWLPPERSYEHCTISKKRISCSATCKSSYVLVHQTMLSSQDSRSQPSDIIASVLRASLPNKHPGFSLHKQHFKSQLWLSESAYLPWAVLAVTYHRCGLCCWYIKKKSNETSLPFGTAVEHDQDQIHDGPFQWRRSTSLGLLLTMYSALAVPLSRIRSGWKREGSKKRLRLSNLLHKKKK
jgi:hypothetical protein